MTDAFPEDARRLIDACDLVRSSGYAVVPQHEYDLWNRWLKEGRERSIDDMDMATLLGQQLQHLEGHVRGLLDGSRPRWWRDHLRAHKEIHQRWIDRRRMSGPAVTGPYDRDGGEG